MTNSVAIAIATVVYVMIVRFQEDRVHLLVAYETSGRFDHCKELHHHISE